MITDGMIFDLDGTLWDSTDAVLKAWNSVLKESKRQITREQLEGCMGLQAHQIGEILFPDLDSKMQNQFIKNCMKVEYEFLNEQGGILYNGLEETLKKLSAKCPLFIVSNCGCGYIEIFLAHHNLEKYFVDFEYAKDAGLSKGENIKKLMERNKLKNAIYIGDTKTDRDAAKLANIPFVYASYGFGDVKDYDYIIDNIEELSE